MCSHYRSIYSVCSRFKLPSLACIVLLRWFQPAFGLPGPAPIAFVYFVTSAICWRCPFMSSPRIVSLVPLVYTLAVSTKFQPASRKAL
jgi:hypothetical protein